MTVKKSPDELIEKLTNIISELEIIIGLYLDEYAEYGWDAPAETFANLAAQLYMEQIRLNNAVVKNEMYR